MFYSACKVHLTGSEWISYYLNDININCWYLCHPPWFYYDRKQNFESSQIKLTWFHRLAHNQFDVYAVSWEKLHQAVYTRTEMMFVYSRHTMLILNSDASQTNLQNNILLLSEISWYLYMICYVSKESPSIKTKATLM